MTQIIKRNGEIGSLLAQSEGADGVVRQLQVVNELLDNEDSSNCRSMLLSTIGRASTCTMRPTVYNFRSPAGAVHNSPGWSTAEPRVSVDKSAGAGGSSSCRSIRQIWEARLSYPLAFFIPEHVPDPWLRASDGELGVEVVFPDREPLRLIRLGIKTVASHDPVPIEDLNGTDRTREPR